MIPPRRRNRHTALPNRRGGAKVTTMSDANSPSVIALVDDDRNILTSVSIALQGEGFVVRMYSDGDTALKALIENPPDLAVLDI